MPSALKVNEFQFVRELGQLLLRRGIQRFLLQVRQETHSIVIEVSLRDQRIDVALSSEKPSDVSAIFEQQRVGFVFGMPLKKHEHASAILNERVSACIGCLCKLSVPTTYQLVDWKTVPAGVRKLKA